MEFLALALVELAIPLLVSLSAFMVGLIVMGGDALLLTLRPLGNPAFRRWLKRIFMVCSGILLLLLAVVTIINLFFFAPFTRWTLGPLEKRAGISVDFREARGSLITGQFNFTGLTAARTGGLESGFRIGVDSVSLDISMIDLLKRKVVFEELKVSGVEGSWERQSRNQKTLNPRRAFHLNNFQLTGANISIGSPGAAQNDVVSLRLDNLSAPSLRSDLLVFDLFFRSEISGAFNGRQFSIGSRTDQAGGRASYWRAEDIPLESVSQIIDGPLKWFKKGRLTVDINSSLQDGDNTALMVWNLKLSDIRLEAPEGSSLKTRLSMTPLTALLNGRTEPLDLSFQLKLNPDDLKFATASYLVNILKEALGDGLINSLIGFKDKIVKRSEVGQ
ncbi:hypothetical protein C4J81_14110 [Deltaproteobacteria bacterium Smac51]|nr:hypothetical protein C4J81_14110 [Deltaproteobacteria bacterium Smac51]